MNCPCQHWLCVWTDHFYNWVYISLDLLVNCSRLLWFGSWLDNSCVDQSEYEAVSTVYRKNAAYGADIHEQLTYCVSDEQDCWKVKGRQIIRSAQYINRSMPTPMKITFCRLHSVGLRHVIGIESTDIEYYGRRFRYLRTKSLLLLLTDYTVKHIFR